MKANEAPEKIYLDEDESWHLTNPNGDSVEYTRTDAFIEKACEWLSTNFDEIGKHYFEFVKIGKEYNPDMYIEKFVKAMKL